MKLRFKVDTKGISTIGGFLPSFADDSEALLAQTVLKDTRPYVPARTLSLSQRAHTEGGLVIYPGPYARYLYYGKVMVGPPPKEVTDKDLVFSTAAHEKAQAHWFEASKAQNLNKWVKVVQKNADKRK